MTHRRDSRQQSARRSWSCGTVAFLGVLSLAACNDQSPFAASNETEASGLESAGAASHADVFVIDGGAVVGKATLVRRSDAVSAALTTEGLVPGDAVTMWWVAFQNPEACVDGCGEDDLFREGVNGGLYRADGRVVGGAGRAAFTGKLETGTESLFVPNVFSDPAGSEIHLVLQTHGEAFADPEAREEQLSAPFVGCNPDCVDVQAAIFLP